MFVTQKERYGTPICLRILTIGFFLVLATGEDVGPGSALFRESLPLPLDRGVSILADGTIPVLLLIMGMQLQNSPWSDHLSALGLANLMRLVVAPILALGTSLLFHLKGPGYQAGVLESAMPSAVMLTVLATEYDIEPAFLTTAVMTSTLLSPLTLTPLLAYLGV